LRGFSELRESKFGNLKVQNFWGGER